jgi:hypothetical protein
MRSKLAYATLIFPVANVIAWGFFAYIDWPLILALRARVGRNPDPQTYVYYLGIPAALIFLSLAHAIFCLAKRQPRWLIWQAALVVLIGPYLVFYVGGV